MSSGTWAAIILVAIIALAIGVWIGNIIQQRKHQQSLDQAHDSATGIIEAAKKRSIHA